MKLSKWQTRHFNRAKTVASWSKDDSTKVGCVAVVEGKYQIMDGYNGLPDYLDDDNPKYWKRPDKYEFVEHAERNMLYKMKKFNIVLGSFDLYVLWFPCPPCMRALIANGCKRIYCNLKNHSLTKSDEYKRKFMNSFIHASESETEVFFTLDEVNYERMTFKKMKKLLNT